MTHSDDDGLIIPPRLAPKHVVILPIYRSDEERSQVISYCESLKSELLNSSSDQRVKCKISGVGWADERQADLRVPNASPDPMTD